MVQTVTKCITINASSEEDFVPRIVLEIASDVIPMMVRRPPGTQLMFCPVTRTTWLVYSSEPQCPGCGKCGLHGKSC